MQNSILPIALLRRSLIDKLARSSGWLRRAHPGKPLTPVVFVQALVASVATGARSLRELAVEVGLLTGGTISKQGLSKRIDKRAVKFLKLVAGEALRRAACKVPELAGQIGGVRRILVGDSSTLALHPSLAEHFPGATNHTDKTVAQIRLQLTFDLLGGRWLHAKIDPYRRNDKSAAYDIIRAVVRAGDLVVRDLGYASIGSFRAIAAKGAYFLSRLSPAVGVFEPGGKRVDVLALARTRAPRPGDSFTAAVELGAVARYACRLVVIKVPQKVGDERRRRLKDDAGRRGCKPHRKDYLALQDWSVFVTNLGADQASDAQLRELYALRWRIENIFKLAKSQSELLKVAGHRTNRHHAEALVWAWLLMMVALSTGGAFRLCGPGGADIVETSIFKSVDRVIRWLALGIELAGAGDIPTLLRRLTTQQEYHDRYEKRNRISIPDRFRMALGHDLKPRLG